MKLETAELRKKKFSVCGKFQRRNTPPLFLTFCTVGHLRKDCNPVIKAQRSGLLCYAESTTGGGSRQMEEVSEKRLREDMQHEGGSQETDTGTQGVSGEAAAEGILLNRALMAGYFINGGDTSPLF